MAAGAVGCSGDDLIAEVNAEQSATAEALAACLREAGFDAVAFPSFIPVGYEEMFSVVEVKSASKEYAVNIPGSGGGASAGLAPRYSDRYEADEPFLIEGDTDHTETLLACIDSSGYFMPNARFDPREETVERQAIADSSNLWLACARENGYPELADAIVQADNWTTRTEALLPSDISPDQLNALLEACPPFDPERDLALGPNGYQGDWRPQDPQIGFDLPDGDPRRQALLDTLHARVEQFYREAGAPEN
ncbi:MAG: hypothetical protein LBD90_07625 [Bifidobacteriaceae bacterium]|jgi:hypothetical protein|nr:hypothetical protein [Bifidobacteriaceae bacterium]